MAKILPFATAQRTRKRYTGGGTAEVVIFPGIRVEYHDEPTKPAGSPRRRARRKGQKRAISS
jgi:hypothetical protein